MRRNQLWALFGLVALTFAVAFCGFRVEAQGRLERPITTPLVIEYRTDQFIVYCEEGTGNRVYFAYQPARNGVAVVEGGCL